MIARAARRAFLLIGGLVAVLVLAPAAWAVSTASVNNGVLTVTGSSGNDVITVSWDTNVANPYTVSDPGLVTPGAGCVPVGAYPAGTPRPSVTCSRNGVIHGAFRVAVNALGGADQITSFQNAQVLDNDKIKIDAGDGNDAVHGSVNAESISGGPGNDLVDGGQGDDIVSGYVIGHLGEANGPTFGGGVPAGGLSASAGTDQVYGGGGSDMITDGDLDTGATGGQPGDVLSGTRCAVAGCDPVGDGGEDSDFLLWGHRTKPVGADLATTVAGTVASAGGATGAVGARQENDTIGELEAIAGGSANDTLLGNRIDQVGLVKDDSLRGNGGNDYIDGREGDDEILAGGGQDVLIGGAGADVLNPGGNPAGGTIEGSGGVVTNDGKDTIVGGPHGTLDDFGRPTGDLVTYDGRSDALTINLTTQIGGVPGENDSIAEVEDIMGGHAGDNITGNTASNLITGDPVPVTAPLPGEPPIPPLPPGGEFGNDTINTRDDISDTADCGGGAGDVHLADQNDPSVGCESVQLIYVCNDGKDNDGDGMVDHPADPGCSGPSDRSEDPNPPACNDGRDNDGDGKIDLADVGCTDRNDNDEFNRPDQPKPQCSDGKDNDGDGLRDYPADPGCSAAGDNDERDSAPPCSGGNCNPPPPSSGTRIGGPSSAGRIRVRRDGSFRLSKNVIDCAGRASCRITTPISARLTAKQARASARKKSYSLGSASYTVRAGNKAAARSKLSTKRMRTLRRLGSIRATVTIRVVQGGETKTKKVSVTLQRPRGR